MFQVIVAKSSKEFALAFGFGKQGNKQRGRFERGAVISLTLAIRIVTVTNAWERAMTVPQGSLALLR